jgi:uncharacterized protein (DUF58 family)
MTNPTSARRAPAAARSDTSLNRARRRRLARAIPAGVGLIACLLLAAAAAVDGQAAAVVLALWVGVLVVVGLRLSEPPAARPARASRPRPAALVPASLRLRTNRRPVLVLAELDEHGGLGSTQTLPVVASEAAIAVLDSRPRG